MKLMTEEIKKKMPKMRDQEEVEDPIVYVKFFDPCGSATWFATEYDPEERMFFGLADLGFPELGYFSLDELEGYKGPLGIGIERDKFFTPKKLSECR